MKTNQIYNGLYVMITVLSLAFVFCECNLVSKEKIPSNTLSKEETKGGWVLLFDGKTSKGWRGACKEKFPEQGWSTDGGMLTILPGGKGGDIVTDSMYSNFVLSFDFKAPLNSNSGVKYFVLEDEYEKGKALGLEYQTHDTGKRPLADKDTHPNTIACLYDLLQATNRHLNPVGEWNNGKIVANGKHIEHWLNGVMVLRYERGGEEFRKAVANSKFSVYPNFGEALRGHILIQDHNDSTSFRNIKIREFYQ